MTQNDQSAAANGKKAGVRHRQRKKQIRPLDTVTLGTMHQLI